MLTVSSFQISDSIDLKSVKEGFTTGGRLYYSNFDELFYKISSEQYLHIFKYGVVCFLNFDNVKKIEFIKQIFEYCKGAFENQLQEEFTIETNSSENKFGFNKVEIMNADEETIRLVTLNVSQSVALSYYSQQTTLLMEEANQHTLYLEKHGKLAISGIKLKKYIGRTLNLKNRIAENLYMFDATARIWEDENLNKIDIGLKKTFDLQLRSRNLHEELEIIKDNLELFIDIMHHSKSRVLELIVIILILVEVLNMLVEKIFYHIQP